MTGLAESRRRGDGEPGLAGLGAGLSESICGGYLQSRIADERELNRWFAEPDLGVALIGGGISGNLEVIDFDCCGEAMDPWLDLVRERMPGVARHLIIELTPSGGFHVIYRCPAGVGRNDKLATRVVKADGPEGVVIARKVCRGHQDRETGEWISRSALIETRGEGGYCACAPTPGYVLLCGDLKRIPVVTAEERATLLALARSFDEDTGRDVRLGRSGDTPQRNLGDQRPGDDFSGRGDIRSTLQQHGWKLTKGGTNEHWCRPGKEEGTSATLKDGVFYVFSSNAHRTRAGYRIAAGNDTARVDLFRYAAWLAVTLHEKNEAEDNAQSYEAYRDRKAREARAMSLAGREIGELPAVVDPQRKQHAAQDFRAFCESYFPLTFHLNWSADHLRVIAKIEKAVLEGGLFAMAMPRGSGKTSLCETACLWAMLYGHREFVALIGSDEEHATDMLDSIKAELEHNEALGEDFPEVCFPIRSLEGITQRSSGQIHQGKQTHIGWMAKQIILPSIEGSASSGAIIRVGGITGRIRGMKYKRPDSRSVRPSLVLIDDPQTDESARSATQCAARERILAGAILGLAGPNEKIAGLLTVTVVRPDDLADRILDQDKHPQWQGERTKLVYSFPDNEALWADYARERAEGLRSGTGLSRATALYTANRAAMDAGAKIAWPQRFHHDEVSAVQHAMNLRLQDEAAFFAEYQNQPLPEVEADEGLLSADQIASKLHGLRKGEVPIGCSHLTLFIDVQGKALYWLVAAWSDEFSGFIVDYGTEPEQDTRYFSLREIRRTLTDASPTAGTEGSIFAGLDSLCDRLLGEEWKRDDGAMMRIGRCLIDANWGVSTDVVYQFCRQSDHAPIVMPAHGRYVGASSIPFSEYRKKAGDRAGLNWRIPVLSGRRAVRHMTFDTNYWKSFVHSRLAVPMGDPGSLSLYGRKPERHRLIAEHLTSEYRVRTEGRGRTVDEWKLRVAGIDNHWLDCLVGSAVAASMEGAILFGTDAKLNKRRRIRASELQRQKWAERRW